jgi:Flavin containing amine oxidoreductase
MSRRGGFRVPRAVARPAVDGRSESIAIVGGGIAGLYCARELAYYGHDVTVLETRREFGGRIQTESLAGFKAEFGPMRFELELQPLFDDLRKQLNIDVTRFAGPTAGQSPTRYSLPDSEHAPDGTELDPLNLLRVAIYKLFALESDIQRYPTEIGDEPARWFVKLKKPDALDHLIADFDKLRTDAKLRAGYDRSSPYLRDLGFWNALSEVLSHPAVTKIRDQGTFYHLIPDNPNAVEWAIFWLRLFTLGELDFQAAVAESRGHKKKAEALKNRAALTSIPHGVNTVYRELIAEIRKTRSLGKVSLQELQEVTAIGHGRRPHSVALDVIDKRPLEARPAGPLRPYRLEFDRAILALPKAPLLKLAANFPTDVVNHLHDVIGFPLLKAFLVMNKPSAWKEHIPAAQQNAWLAPTRELHYFTDAARPDLVMVLLYTDQPATAYWKHFIIDPQHHDGPQIGKPPALKRDLIRYLARSLQEEYEAAPTPGGTTSLASRLWQAFGDWATKRPDDIPSMLWRRGVTAFAIRDWSTEPFGAGCHAWRPGARSWEARKRLNAFGLIGRDGRSPRADSTILGENERNIHICGEAYSDYQGFIEGALRSATDVLKLVVDGYETPTERRRRAGHPEAP